MNVCLRHVLICSSLIVLPGNLLGSGYTRMAEQILKNFSSLKESKNSPISQYERYQTALKILHETSHHFNEATLSDTTIRDLNLFFYDVQRPDFTVLNAIKRTHTTLGTCVLGHMLITPKTNLMALTNRYMLIKELIKNEALRIELDTALAVFKKSETHLLALWNPCDIVYSKNLRKTFYGTHNLQRSKWNNAGWLNFKTRYNDIMGVGGILIGQFIVWYIRQIGTKNPDTPLTSLLDTFLFVVQYAIIPIGFLLSGSNSINNIKNRIYLMQTLKERFVSLVQLSTLLTQLRKIFTVHTQLPRMFSALSQLIHSTSTQSQEHNEIQTFLRHLQAPAFGTQKGYFATNVGKVLSALPTFVSLKNRFGSILHTIGKLDAYLSIAKLYKEHERTEHAYHFANFILTKETPRFVAQNFWHPALPKHQAVANSLALGNTHPQNIVLTGPNAAGKSTILKAQVLTVLFAQTLTIVPADYAELTPFSRISTYLNIVDNIGANQSQHRAEVLRTRELINTVLSLKPHEFSLTIMDEMFRSTNPITGAAASFAVAKGLSKFPNNILLLATHFGKLTALPEHTNNAFSNYRVNAQKNSDGSFTYPYKLEEGYNQKVIALDLLQYEGFAPDILAYAYEHLEHLQQDHERVTEEDAAVNTFVIDLRHRIEEEIEKQSRE